MTAPENDLGEGGAAPSPGLSDGRDPDPDPDLAKARGEHSLRDDIDALIADGRTYLQAELSYQKSRAGFTANRLKWAAAYGAAAFGLLHLALIALTVGAVIALAPLVGPWIATAAVVAVLLAGAFGFSLKLRGKLADIRSAFEDKAP